MNLGWPTASSLSGPLYFQYMARITGNSRFPLFCVINGENFPKTRSIRISHAVSHTRKMISESIETFGEHDFFLRRFKHTKLTHLAILGAPVHVLARAGYQTSLNSLRHYTNLNDDAFENYEDLMHKSHENLLTAFRGKIIEERDATNKDVKHRIISPDLKTDLGACATNPISLYTSFFAQRQLNPERRLS